VVSLRQSAISCAIQGRLDVAEGHVATDQRQPGGVHA
jgi:hypothetical protein